MTDRVRQTLKELCDAVAACAVDDPALVLQAITLRLKVMSPDREGEVTP